MSSRLALLHQADYHVARWVIDHYDEPHYGWAEGSYKATGVLRDGEILAGFVYHNWIPEFGTMEMSLASVSPRWASRAIVRALLSYPFVERACQRITVVTAEDNSKALRLAEGVGFSREAVIERAYGMGRNAVLLRLFREDWEAGKYGKVNGHG